MAKIGLVDVDGHNFPNLALMRIAAYHKAQGDEVEWWLGDLFHYDVVYKSKVFSDAYSQDIPDPMNADYVYKGGTGYAISLVDGREVFDNDLCGVLPQEIETMKPDYSIYPEYDFAVAMTTRGCPRGCPFCVVGKKEGRCSRKVADVSDFYAGQKHIEILDPNITACKDRFDLYEQYIDTGAILSFNQGLDIRLITEKDIEYLNKMKIEDLHFAWDNPKDDLEDKFRMFSEMSIHNMRNRANVFCLVNYNSTMEENLHRIYTLRDLGYNPYVMVYDKPHASKEIRHLQRWVNNKYVFRSCPDFADYQP